MTDERSIDLMQRVLDGVGSETDRAALQSRLQRDPGTRELFAQLTELKDLLGRVTDAEPPADLKGKVLLSLPARERAEPAGAAQRSRAGLPRTTLLLRYAYAVAVGVLLGGLVMFWLLASSGGLPALDVTDLYGAMTRQPRTAAVHEGALAYEELSGFVKLYATETGCFLEALLVSADAVEVVLDFDPGQVQVQGFAAVDSPGVHFAAEPGRLTWSHAGRHRYAVLLSGPRTGETELNLEFRVDGRPVGRRSVHVPSGESR